MPVQNAPQRARKSRQPAKKSSLSFLPRIGGWPRRRIVLAGIVLIAATGIAVNALVLQSARHPAPLFAAVEQARVDAARKAAAAARAAPVAATPLPPARPVAEAPPAPIPAPAQPAPQQQSAVTAPPEPQSLAKLMADAAEKPARAEKPAAAAVVRPAPDKQTGQDKPARAAAKPDALGELIRGGIVPPGGIPSEPDPKIQRAQRALARLGATSIKADGFMGPATKAAIEKFERDKKWPVTGEISPRLLRELGAVSAARP